MKEDYDVATELAKAREQEVVQLQTDLKQMRRQLDQALMDVSLLSMISKYFFSFKIFPRVG